MIFLIVFLCLTGISILSVYKNRRYKKLSILILLFLFLFSSLRYSLGADYFSYAYIYESMPYNLIEALQSELHSEVGFKILIVLTKKMGVSYEVFLAFLSAASISLFGSIIIKKSKYPLVSIQILYTFYYLVYINSSVRQGLAMSLVFYGVHKFYFEDKDKEFIVLVFFAGLLHNTAFFVLLIYVSMFVYKKIILNEQHRMLQVLTGLYVIAVLLLNATRIPYIIFVDILKLSRIEPYFTESVNVMALGVKVLLFIFISLIYFFNKNSNNKISQQYYMMYVTGFLVYLLSMSAPISSRILDYFTMFEILLIPFIIYSKSRIKIKFNIFGIWSVLLLVLLVKDIHYFTYQEEYKKTGFFQYRYFSIFEKEKIEKYKEKNYYLQILEDLDK